MGKIHRVRKSSRKKSKYHDVEADVLGSFYFEDSPQKEEVVAGSRSSHGDSEFFESSSSSTAFCVSNHSNKGLFFSNCPIHVSKEASCEHSIEKVDCYACDNGVVAGRIHVFGEERDPENNSTDSLISPHEAVDSEIKRKEVVEEIDPALVFGVGSVRENDIEGSFTTLHATFEPGVNHEAYEDPAKIDGLVEDCSDSEAMEPVLEFPSSGIISPVATSPAPSSGSASRPPLSFPCLSSVFFLTTQKTHLVRLLFASATVFRFPQVAAQNIWLGIILFREKILLQMVFWSLRRLLLCLGRKYT